MITNIFLSAPSRYEAMIANVMVTDVTIYWQLQTIVLSSKDKKSKKNKKKEKEKRNLNRNEKIVYSLFSGFCGALVGNPADVILYRFRLDASLPQTQRRNYGNIIKAFTRIVSEEGIGALWNGLAINAIRGMAVTVDRKSTRLNSSH